MTESEYKSFLKIFNNVAPVRSLHGRSKDGVQCRRCSGTENFVVETLPHVLGQCPYNSLLRNTRHHTIRKMIADQFRKKGLEVYEEVMGVEDNGSIRRSDIIVLDR